MKKAILAAVVCMFLLVASADMASANPATEAGLGWLQSTQNSTGSWGNTPASLTDEYLATAEARS